MPTRQTTRYPIRRVYVQSGPDQGVQAFPVDPPLSPYEVELDMAYPEDPVTGSLNAGIGQWLLGSGQAQEHYVAAQGTRLGRAGRVSVDRAGDDVWVGGHSVTVLRGTAAF